MKVNVVAVITLGTALLFQSGCTKAPPEQTKAAPEAKAAPEPTKAAPEPTKAERIRAIDAQLANWVSTGRPEDADRRLALKAERTLLAADLGYSTPAVAPVSAPVVLATPVNPVPIPIIAQDSTRAENRWQGMAGGASWMSDQDNRRVYDTTRHGPHWPYVKTGP